MKTNYLHYLVLAVIAIALLFMWNCTSQVRNGKINALDINQLPAEEQE